MNKNCLFGFCAILAGIALVMAGLWLLLKPAEYQASVTIKIEAQYPPGTYQPYDPYFLETEFKIIASDNVLSNVVETLNLETVFGRRYGYGNGQKIDNREAIKLLRRRIDILPIQNTWLTEIQVRDEDPNEAARIANAIAAAYHDYRIDVSRREMASGIKMLEGGYQEEATNIMRMEANLRRLAKESNLTNADLPDAILRSKYLSYYQAKMELNGQEDLHNQLAKIIDQDRAAAGQPLNPIIAIVASAVPPQNPIARNWWVVAVCLGCGLVFVGRGFYLVRVAER